MSVFDLRRRTLANLRRPDGPPAAIDGEELSLLDDRRERRRMQHQSQPARETGRRG
jgi:hypothetical protein